MQMRGNYCSSFPKRNEIRGQFVQMTRASLTERKLCVIPESWKIEAYPVRVGYTIPWCIIKLYKSLRQFQQYNILEYYFKCKEFLLNTEFSTSKQGINSRPFVNNVSWSYMVRDMTLFLNSFVVSHCY